jgi:hypothetical protein
MIGWQTRRLSLKELNYVSRHKEENVKHFGPTRKKAKMYQKGYANSKSNISIIY